MATTTTYPIIAQSAPSATTNTDILTVAASTEYIVSAIYICNRGSTDTTFRIAIRENGDVIANKHYIYYDVSIPANDTFLATTGITLEATDVITVYAGNSNLSFSMHGSKIVTT